MTRYFLLCRCLIHPASWRKTPRAGICKREATKDSKLSSNSHFVRKLLCYTLLGRKLFYYEAYRSSQKYKTNAIKDQKIIILLVRSRPNQSNANLVIKEFMDQLLNFSNEKESAFLRDNFFFIIIPCLNPDGVLVGNSRCSLSGQDLNRVWGNPDRYLHPEVYYTKRLIKKLKQRNDIIFFTEFHSNLTKPACFISGNDIKSNRKLPREFPALMFEACNGFELELCKYFAVI